MPTHKPLPNSSNIWLVDSDEAFRRSYAESLQASHGVRCERQFDSGEQMIEALQTVLKLGANGPDAVILDQMLPGISGASAVRCIKDISPATVVLVYAAIKSHTRVAEALAGGASGYFPKYGPVDAVVAVVGIATRARQESAS